MRVATRFRSNQLKQSKMKVNFLITSQFFLQLPRRPHRAGTKHAHVVKVKLRKSLNQRPRQLPKGHAPVDAPVELCTHKREAALVHPL